LVKTLKSLGSQMLTRMIPAADASADTCTVEHACIKCEHHLLVYWWSESTRTCCPTSYGSYCTDWQRGKVCSPVYCWA
jgi:hypothetical protein